MAVPGSIGGTLDADVTTHDSHSLFASGGNGVSLPMGRKIITTERDDYTEIGVGLFSPTEKVRSLL